MTIKPTPDQMMATDFLIEIGYPTSIKKQGAAAILKAIRREGLNPVEMLNYGKGIRLFVDTNEAKKMIKSRREQHDDVEEIKKYGRPRRDVRSVARALLHLYRLLGEEPHPSSRLAEIAERDD